MKLLGLLLLAASGGILVWVALGAPEPTYVPPKATDAVPAQIAEPPPEGFELVTLDVDGMCCSGCSAKLYAVLAEQEGVRAAAVDPVLGEAHAIVPAGAAAEPLARALTFDDYVATVRPPL